MREILLIGGGGHCKSVIDVVEQEGSYEIAGIVDKNKPLGSLVCGYKVLGSDDDLRKLSSKYDYALVTIGQVSISNLRESVYHDLIKLGFTCPKIISPEAYVSPFANIGNGTVVHHRVTINADVHIGENCIINSHALVEHDCRIESHCHVSTGSTLNGGVKVGKGSFIGSGAIVIEASLIEPDSFVRAGSIVR